MIYPRPVSTWRSMASPGGPRLDWASLALAGSRPAAAWPGVTGHGLAWQRWAPLFSSRLGVSLHGPAWQRSAPLLSACRGSAMFGSTRHGQVCLSVAGQDATRQVEAWHGSPSRGMTGCGNASQVTARPTKTSLGLAGLPTTTPFSRFTSARRAADRAEAA